MTLGDGLAELACGITFAALFIAIAWYNVTKLKHPPPPDADEEVTRVTSEDHTDVR